MWTNVETLQCNSESVYGDKLGAAGFWSEIINTIIKNPNLLVECALKFTCLFFKYSFWQILLKKWWF